MPHFRPFKHTRWIVALGLGLAAMPAFAAEPNLSDLLSAARDGGPGREVALSQLTEMAEAGNALAAYGLGEYYYRFAETPDPARAADYYLEALQEGDDERALTRLGDIYRSQEVPGLDPAQAVEFYRQAAESGNATGMLRMGETYAAGEHVARDLETAITYYESAAENGNSYGALRLGDLYREGADGLDPQKAIPYFEAAAEADNSWAQVRLGDLYREGEIVEADPETAESWYRRALDNENSVAFLRIANGLVAGTVGTGGRAAGLDMLDRGAREGVPQAAMTLSRLLLSGEAQDADIGRALEVLEADAASPSAQARLVSLLSGGMDQRISPDLVRARTALVRLQGLDEVASAAPAALLAAAQTAATPTPAAMTAAGEALAAVSGRDRPAVIRQMAAISPNAYVAGLQQLLSESGHYDGPVSGILAEGTIAGINRFCADKDIAAACSGGPLSDAAVKAIAAAL